MRYTEEVFSMLSKGGFISSNSCDANIRKLYDDIEDDEEAYATYYERIGFILEGGNGFYFFSRKNESRIDIERKLDSFGKWIDYLDFIKTYDPGFGANSTFRKANILEQLSRDVELQDKASKLFPSLKKQEEIIEKLISEMTKIGFVEEENEIDNTYRVTSAFHYIEQLVECLTINEEITNEIPE